MTEGLGTMQHELGELTAAVRALVNTMDGLPAKFEAAEKHSTELFNKCLTELREYQDMHKQYHKDREPYWGAMAWAHKFPFRFTMIVIGGLVFLTILNQEGMKRIYGFLAKTILSVL